MRAPCYIISGREGCHVISLHENNPLYDSEGNAEENEEDESRSNASKGSPHSDIFSCIKCGKDPGPHKVHGRAFPICSFLRLFLWLTYSKRQIWLAQTSLPETIRKELTNFPVVPGRVFHTDSQYLLDTAISNIQARHRRESVQQTFGGPTTYGHRAAQFFQPSHFPRSEPWGYDLRRTRGYQSHD